jgi:hypothetical protein
MNRSLRRLTVLILVAAGAAPVLAQGADDAIIGSLPSWDYNHDGIYTCANWKRYMAELFSKADRKKRGYIDANEFEAIKAAEPMFASAEFAYFDSKGTGRLTRSDFVDWPSPFFIRYDSRHTCRVARADLNVPQAAPQPTRRGRGRRG